MNREIFKVVKIISEYSVVINAGSEQGLKLNDELEIFIPGNPVIDPDTGEELGTLDLIKAYIEVTDVFEKMSICKNINTVQKGFLESINTLNALTFTRTERVRLNVDSSQISNDFSDLDSQIRIGDLVRKKL
jgi:hypothetical protein